MDNFIDIDEILDPQELAEYLWESYESYRTTKLNGNYGIKEGSIQAQHEFLDVFDFDQEIIL